MCATGHRLVESGRSVLFTPAYRLVQDMLAAKRDLDLPRMLRKLDNIDFLLIDDLGYLPQGAEESEVLFTPHSRAVRTPLSGHHLQPRLLSVGEGLRQPYDHCSCH